MEALYLNQEDLYEKLKKAERNFKKTPKDRLRKSYLETRVEALEKIWIDFKNGHRQIISCVSKEEKAKVQYFTEDVYDLFEELYITYKSVLRDALQPFITTEAISIPSLASTSSPSNISDVKLPRIQLPTFTGNYNEWQTFYDMFVSLIHDNKTLSPVQKLHYLKSSLSGEPEKLIRNFATTDLNYEEAWKQLTKRYNNKRYNCQEIMKTLFSQKQINLESAYSIKQLLDTTSACLKALNNLGVKTDSWDAIIIYLVTSKLDPESHKQWEYQQVVVADDLPSWCHLVDFLEARFRSLEMIDSSKILPRAVHQSNSKPTVRAKSFHSSVKDEAKLNEAVCAMCDGQHYVYHCKKYIQLPTQEKQNLIQIKKLCFNCFSPTHSVKKCRQLTSCRRCGRRHHTSLHFDKDLTQGTENNTETIHAKPNRVEVSQTQREPTNETRIVANFSKGVLQNNNVLLATAVVKVNSRNSSKYFLRALLDQGSQASFVTEATVQLLGLKRILINGCVSGLGEVQDTKIKYMVKLCIESRHNTKIVHVNAYVLNSITSLLPTSRFVAPDWPQLEELSLADPGYAVPSNIDMLLGAEVYGEILLSGMIKHPQESIIAQNTVLGWVLSGRLSSESNLTSERLISMHLQIREDHFLRQFWEQEAEPNSIKKEMTEEEKMCEESYIATTKRDDTGRFIVRLPFKNPNPECQYGQSKDIATKRLHYLEKRLNNNSKLYNEYQNVLEEYIDLNHMELVSDEDINDFTAVYLPHHAVVREDKETTRIRIVFDASCKGVNDVSLNDNLMVGPKLQQDLRHILMRWRKHKICIVADLVKMYRQVRVHEKDTKFQRILWRPVAEHAVKHYKLLTLTFGTACAPYLAVKSIQYLAELEKSKFPIAAEITLRDYYMDDLMSGCNTVEEAIQIYQEMCKLMKCGGFVLQKWSSNNKLFLQHINEDNRAKQSVPIKVDSTVKVLGICWNRDLDKFEYTVNLPELSEHTTKRKVLSDIARLYDPKGWIAPVVIKAKIFIQNLWKSGLEWDDRLTDMLMSEWLEYRSDLANLKDILIPRWLNFTPGHDVELHAFSDASKSAYAAAVYIRIIDNEQNKVHVSLVTAKTKVAPSDKEASIPRLELCGATLAAKLLSEVAQVMDIPKTKLFAWTDSTIVLAWLKGPASRWHTYVSNRVSEILTILDYEQWGHVISSMNPADCASRGTTSRDLIKHDLWWSGPTWLLQSVILKDNIGEINTNEEEKVKTLIVTDKKDISIESLTAKTNMEDNLLWTKFSSLNKMLKVISYCRRILRFKKQKQDREEITKFITREEMNETLLKCIEQVQGLEFAEEIKQLKIQNCVMRKSALHSLNPIFDKNGILRVGGRIQQAHLSYDQRHPILLPAKSHLTRLLISNAHLKTLHGGPQVMLNYLRTKYWILRARDQVKKYYGSCVKCLRYSRVRTNQLMGQLPEVRLKPSKAFKSTGVDYAGPINIRFSPGRGSKSYKGYICLFVCMVTRAIHLEAVTGLTTQAFIAAFRRFTSRRGHCQDLFSVYKVAFYTSECS